MGSEVCIRDSPWTGAFDQGPSTGRTHNFTGSQQGTVTIPDVPLLDVGTRTDTEPRVRIPQPPGWERYTEMDSDVVRAALINKALTADKVTPNVVYTLDTLPNTVDATQALAQERDGLERMGGATDLEVTESMVMPNPDRAVTTTPRLRAILIAASIDDFATRHPASCGIRIDEHQVSRPLPVDGQHDAFAGGVAVLRYNRAEGNTRDIAGRLAGEQHVAALVVDADDRDVAGGVAGRGDGDDATVVAERPAGRERAERPAVELHRTHVDAGGQRLAQDALEDPRHRRVGEGDLGLVGQDGPVQVHRAVDVVSVHVRECSVVEVVDGMEETGIRCHIEQALAKGQIPLVAVRIVFADKHGMP